MEAPLTSTTFTGILQFVALAISFAVIGSSATLDDNQNSSSVCSTDECIQTASRILKNMNPDVEPCDDFYDFACGGFEENTSIPDDESSVNAFSIISDTIDQQLHVVLERPSELNETRHCTLAKNLYRACMNETAIEEAGLEPLREILQQLGGWPVLEGDSWNDGEFNWTTAVLRARHLGYWPRYVIGFDIGTDIKNSTERVLILDQASLGLSREYLIQGRGNEIVEAYLNYTVKIAGSFGAEEDTATRELAESLEFEIKLANISLSSESRSNVTLLYNPMTIAELEERYSYVNWLEFINSMLPRSVQIDDTEVVIVSVPSFFSDLEELLRTTPKRVQANYIMSSIVRDSVEFSTKNLTELQFNYLSVYDGELERPSRWKECVDAVENSLSNSISALYIRNYYKEEARKEAVDIVGVEMVADMKNEFRKILEKTDWMDENTRIKALEKIAALYSFVAYPIEFLDDEKLDEFYSGLELTKDDYLRGILNSSLDEMNNEYGKLKKPVNKTDWRYHGDAAVVNAHYLLTENSIQIPAGILQGTFFGYGRPWYMNFGAIGSIIGHGIADSFGGEGRQYDEYGNFAKWWTLETEEVYLKKAQCIIDQYGNYTAESVGLHLNGINTQAENIADNLGIQAAYLAYQNWVQTNQFELRLQGLDYTPKQLFWISAANNWCENIRQDELKLQIMGDSYSPARFRVIGPFSNMPQFAEDFNCPVGSAMNPEQKCSVW